jgi:hypothetical protein
MKRIITASLVAATAATVCSVNGAPAYAAAPRPTVTVTIVANGTDLSGEVRSRRLACKADRTVVVYQQVGARGGGDDLRFAQDTTGQQGNRWTWSTGNTGTAGKFYAKVGAKAGCPAAVSPTVRAVATP